MTCQVETTLNHYLVHHYHCG